MLAEQLNIETLKEILEVFNVPEDVFQLLLEEFKQAQTKIGVSDEFMECLLETIEQSIIEQKRKS